MKTISSLLGMRLGTDALLTRLACVICFIAAVFVFVFGLLKVCRLDLTDAQLFSGVQQVVQTALMFSIVGLLLRHKS